MKGINSERISALISKKLKRTFKIDTIEKIGSGYHSDGFRLTGKSGENFFLKRVKSHDLGFEFPERKTFSLITSNGMSKRAGLNPLPIGVALENKEGMTLLPEINEETAIYQIQEFLKEGTSYWSMLQGRKQKSRLDREDIAELQKITDFINSVHKIRYPFKSEERRKAVYNDSLRSVLCHPELTIMLLQDFSDSHPILPRREHKNYIGLMLDLIYKWKDRHERLVALHGDFWGANLFFRNDGSLWVIDYSRTPWGDRGIDIGWWLSQYLWFYHETGNHYFRELGEKFLELYSEKSKDKEIHKAVSLGLGFEGVVYISPRIYPNLDVKIGKKFFDNILEILRGGRFIWKR